MVLMKSALGGIPVSAAMMTKFETVAPGDSLEHVSRLILSGSQHDFPSWTLRLWVSSRGIG